jgi:hypothetical protein
VLAEFEPDELVDSTCDLGGDQEPTCPLERERARALDCEPGAVDGERLRGARVQREREHPVRIALGEIHPVRVVRVRHHPGWRREPAAEARQTGRERIAVVQEVERGAGSEYGRACGEARDAAHGAGFGRACGVELGRESARELDPLHVPCPRVVQRDQGRSTAALERQRCGQPLVETRDLAHDVTRGELDLAQPARAGPVEDQRTRAVAQWQRGDRPDEGFRAPCRRDRLRGRPSTQELERAPDESREAIQLSGRPSSGKRTVLASTVTSAPRGEARVQRAHAVLPPQPPGPRGSSRARRRRRVQRDELLAVATPLDDDLDEVPSSSITRIGIGMPRSSSELAITSRRSRAAGSAPRCCRRGRARSPSAR